MGIRGIVQNSVSFNAVRVTRDQMLGEPGKGMQVVEDVLSHGRLATAAVGLGIALRSAQLILRYVSRRDIDTGLLIANPQTATTISEMIHRVEIDRAALLHCADRLDAGDAIVPEIAMAIKVSATNTANYSADLLVQLLGGRGYMENNIAPQLFRDARMLSIGEGANEGLTAAIGRSVRLNTAVPDFLRAYEPTGALAERVASVARALEARGDEGPFTGSSALSWHDAVRGRLAIAALNVAAAVATGEPNAWRWATARLDAICVEAECGTSSMASVLDTSEITARINAFSDTIGDVEPLAPDVDYALDPLLRRAPAFDVSPRGDDSLERKKRRLRDMLTAAVSATSSTGAAGAITPTSTPRE